MNIRFYIDMTVEGNEAVTTVKARFRAAEEGDPYFSSTIGLTIGGLTFKQSEEGTYVEYDHFLFGIPTAITAEANLPVRRVEIYEDFPSSWGGDKDEEPKFSMPKGVYKTDGAQAIVDEYQRSSSDSSMRVRVVADTIEPAIVLFNLIRKGEAKPTEPWRDVPLNETDEVEDKQPATIGS